MNDLFRDAIEELKDWAEANSGEDLDSIIWDIASSLVPIYTYDLLKLALDNQGLATEEADIGGVAVNSIAANVVVAIQNHLAEWWRDYEEELEED